MLATIDSAGRLLVPKSLRDSLGLVPGSHVDISPYGGGAQITPGGRTAVLKEDDEGRLTAHSTTVVTDDMLFAIIDSGRR